MERWEKRQQEKAARADTGITGWLFEVGIWRPLILIADGPSTDFGQMAAKKYNKQIKELKPNLALYEEQKSLAAVASAISSNRDESDFYRDANSMAYANLDNRPDAEAVDRLVQSVNEELVFRRRRSFGLGFADFFRSIAGRSKFSRRRTQRDDDDVNFINDRNKRFNKKISRAFDKYTADIKSSFERGTALD